MCPELPLDISRLRKLLVGNGLAKTLIYRAETVSTNDEALAVARDGGTEGTVFVTDFQIHGRGTRGRFWQSPPNRSLLLSTILRPRRFLKPVELTQLGALGLCQGLRDGTQLDVRIKWPNDAIVHQRKIGGVLVEVVSGRPGAVVIGIGANLNGEAHDIRVSDTPTTSVMQETGMACDREAVISAVINALERSYQALESGCSLSEEWTELSAVVGQRVGFQTETVRYHGLVNGFGDNGELILECDDGVERAFTAGRIDI